MILRALTFLAIFATVVYVARGAIDQELASGAPAAAGIGTAAVYRDGLSKEFGEGLVRVNGKGPEAWRYEWVKADRRADMLQRRLTVRVLEVRALRRALAHDDSATEAIQLAATVYGNGPMLLRRAKCESHLDPNAKNRRSSAAGLFQFLDSTWASTPFAGFSVYSPYANALAAGWMHGPAGRSSEWVCA